MSLRVYVGGVWSGTELTDRIELGEVAGFEELARLGEAATPDIDIDDIDGDYEPLAWKALFAVEDTAPVGDQRIATYYVARRTVDRSDHYRTGASRVYHTSLAEINTISTFRVLKGLEAKRPNESVAARLTWLLGTEEFGTYVQDLGFVNPPDRQMDATDYRKMRAADVLNDCAQIGWGSNWWIYADEAEETFGLFFDTPDATTFESDLRLSNVRTDVNDVDTFYIELAERLERDPSDVNDGVLVVFGDNSMIYRQRAATHDVFAIHRDGVYENPRIGRLSTAESFASQWLVRHSTEDDTIFGTVEVPAALVNEIRRGMRIDVRFQHLPGYETFTPIRVVGRNVRQSRKTKLYYQIDLELSNAGPSGTGGGGGGVPPEPWVPCPPASPVPSTFGVLRYVTVFGTVEDHEFTWADAVDLNGDPAPGDPAAGSTLVCASVFRDPGFGGSSTIEFTQITNIKSQGDSGSDGWDVDIGYREVHVNDTEDERWVAATETLEPWVFPPLSQASVIIELSGQAEVTSSTTAGPAQHGSRLSAGTLTVPTNAVMIGAARIGSADFSPASLITPDDGVTQFVNDGPGPDALIAYRPDSGEIGADVIFGDFLRDWHGGVSAVFLSTEDIDEDTGDDCPPPQPGQPVAPLELDVTACSVLDYTTPFPYQPGSLHVSIRVGAVLTPVLVDEIDPTTGRFRLHGSPCLTVSSTTMFMTVYDAIAEEWKVAFTEDGEPILLDIPSLPSGELPTLIVEFVAGIGEIVDPPEPEPPASGFCTLTVAPGGDIQSAINGADPGDVVCLTAGATYTLTESLSFTSKVGVTLDGQGATLQTDLAPGVPWDDSQELVRVDGGSGNRIHDLTIVGSHDAPGTFHTDGREFQAGIGLFGTHDTIIERVTVRDNMGDAFGVYEGSGIGTTNTWILDCEFSGNGRMGVAAVKGSGLRVKRLTFSDWAWYVYEVEPDVGGTFTDAIFEDGTGSGSGLLLFGVVQVGGNSDIICRNNYVGAGANRGIWSVISEPKDGNRNSNISFTGNTGVQEFNEDPTGGTSLWPVKGVYLVAKCDGAEVSNNTQPVSGGDMYRVVVNDSTSVTKFDNVSAGSLGDYP